MWTGKNAHALGTVATEDSTVGAEGLHTASGSYLRTRVLSRMALTPQSLARLAIEMHSRSHARIRSMLDMGAVHVSAIAFVADDRPTSFNPTLTLCPDLHVRGKAAFKVRLL